MIKIGTLANVLEAEHKIAVLALNKMGLYLLDERNTRIDNSLKAILGDELKLQELREAILMLHYACVELRNSSIAGDDKL